MVERTARANLTRYIVPQVMGGIVAIHQSGRDVRKTYNEELSSAKRALGCTLAIDISEAPNRLLNMSNVDSHEANDTRT